MFCTNCGTKLDDSAVYCTNCGTYVGSYSNAAAQQPQQNAYQTPQQNYQQNAYQNSQQNVNQNSQQNANSDYMSYDAYMRQKYQQENSASQNNGAQSNPYNSYGQNNAYNGAQSNQYNNYGQNNAYNGAQSNPYNNYGQNNAYNGAQSNPYNNYGQNNAYNGAQSNSNNNYGNNSYNNNNPNKKDPIDLKGMLNNGGLERFAPLAALVPIVMAILMFLLKKVLWFVLVGRSFNMGAIKLYMALVRIFGMLFVLIPLAATVWLVYEILQRGKAREFNSWIIPIGTFLATISCLCQGMNWKVVAVLFGLFSVLLGFEFLARVTIAGQSIFSPFNPGAAFEIYSQALANSQANNQESRQADNAAYANAGYANAGYANSGNQNSSFVSPGTSFFDGTGIEMLGYGVLTVLVCMVTCGIAFPWMYCMLTKWRLQHTVINGKRLTFTGTGGSLFGHWILWEILTVITCGIYGLFVYTALRRWELEHTFIESEPVYAGATGSAYDGTTLQYIGYSLLMSLIILCTCGLAFPWALTMFQTWDTSHCIINGRRLRYSGTGLGFLGEYIIIFLLTLITCGIYSYWGIVRMNRYIVRNTDFVD